jgi:hypothetical protein
MAKDEKQWGGPTSAVVNNPTLEAALVENAKMKEEIQALKKLVKDLEVQLGAAGITEDIRDEVNERMRAGLGREDAIEVTRRQRAHDRQLAEQKAKSA